MPPIALASATNQSSPGAITFANNLRIASIAVAVYDYIITLPSEYRLYKTSSRRSLGFILFVLIRYLSIVLFTISAAGFFNHHFTPEICSHYGYLAPVFKVLQVMISQSILGIRAYNIAQRNVWVGRSLVAMYLAVLVVEWFTELYQRIPMMTKGNCVIGTPHPDRAISAWSFYLVSMSYDFLALSISTYYLLKAHATSASAASKLMKILLYDGLIYFVALTAINMVNIFLYRQVDHTIQSSGVNLAYATTWIMSQRILLHVREARAHQTTVIASPPPSMNTLSLSGVRSEGSLKHEAMRGSLTAELPDSHNPANTFDLEVHIDRSIIRDARLPFRREPIARDPQPIPPSSWDRPWNPQV